MKQVITILLIVSAIGMLLTSGESTESIYKRYKQQGWVTVGEYVLLERAHLVPPVKGHFPTGNSQ